MQRLNLDGQPPQLRDPGTFPWGVFLAWSMGHGGEQAFHWFASECEALAFVMSLEDSVFPYVSTTMPPDAESAMAWLCGNARHLSTLPLATIQNEQPAFQIRWAGHVDDLLSSSSRFAWEVRNDYWRCADRETSWQTSTPGGIAAFMAHLRSYARRFPEQAYRSSFTLTAEKGVA